MARRKDKGRGGESPPVYRVTIAGRTRWRNAETGAFAPAPKWAKEEPPEKAPVTRPKVTREVFHGRTAYRAPNGRFAPKPKRPEVVPVAIGRGDRRRYIYPIQAERAEPKGAEGLAMQAWGQSLPKLAEANGAEGRPTYVRWRGEVFAVAPEKAGQLSDLLRLAMSLYVDAFDGIVDSPQLQMDIIETAEGDLLDMDSVAFFNEATSELIEGDLEAEAAAQSFMDSLSAELTNLLT